MSKEEEDEFDDLDDLLDDFVPSQSAATATGTDPASGKPETPKLEELKNAEASATTPGESPSTQKNDATKDATLASGSGTQAPGSASNAIDEADPEISIPELDEQFAEKLKLGVDQLLNEMNDSPEAKQEFEALMAGMANATGSGAAPSATSGGASGGSTGGASGKGTGSGGGGFQDTIAQTMDRLKESQNNMNNTQNQASSSSDEEFLMKMMKEFENASGGGGGDNMDLNGLMAEMLQELSSKEILYEPIKEMQQKYPEWLEKHESECSKEDLDRYKHQQRLVDEMCNKFEEANYSDNDDESRKFIASKMDEMQKTGSPPSDLVGNLAGGAIPGMDMGDSMPVPEELENCNVQ